MRLVDIIARLTAGVAPAAVSATQTSLPPAAQTHLDSVQAQLARSATNLNTILDDNWRRYLAIPPQIFQPGQRPSAQDVAACLARFNDVARNRQYQGLTDRPEFHTTHSLLQALSEDLRAASAPQLALPPPPQAR